MKQNTMHPSPILPSIHLVRHKVFVVVLLLLHSGWSVPFFASLPEGTHPPFFDALSPATATQVPRSRLSPLQLLLTLPRGNPWSKHMHTEHRPGYRLASRAPGLRCGEKRRVAAI